MKYPKYTEAEIEFLREYYPTHGFKDTYKAFCERFGEHTEPQVLHRIKKNKIKSLNDSKFKKGFTPWNTGLKIAEDRPDLYEKQYTNMQRGGCLGGAVTRADVGTISHSKRDGWHIKIANPDKWMLLNRYMYEKYHNVKLAKEDKIIFLDGNHDNFDKDNLFLVNVNTICCMNRKQLWVADAQLNKASALTQMIRLKIKEIENEKER